MCYSGSVSETNNVLIIGAFLSTLCEIMLRVLRGIEKWCDERQLSVNPSKTELILFTRKLKIEGFQSITFYGKTLALSNQVKYLGVLLDSKLSWKNHVEAKCKRALAAFYQVRRAVGTTWGASVTHETCSKLYKIANKFATKYCHSVV